MHATNFDYIDLSPTPPRFTPYLYQFCVFLFFFLNHQVQSEYSILLSMGHPLEKDQPSRDHILKEN